MNDPIDHRRPPARPPRARTVVYRFESKRVGGLQGLVLLLAFLAALAAAVVVGFLALTVVLWIALGVAFAVIVLAVIRALLGAGRR